MAKPSRSDNDDPIFEDRSKPFIIRAFLVIVALVILGFSIKPFQNWLKLKRSGVNIDTAEMLIRDNRPAAEIEPHIRSAVAAAPSDPRTLRTAARFAAAHNRDDGLIWWRQLLGTPTATRDDRLAFIEHALTANRLEFSGPELNDLFRFDASDPQVIRLLIRHHELNDDLNAAISVARHEITIRPGSEAARLALARLLQRHAGSKVREEGRLLLLGLATGESPHHEAAADLLISDPGLSQGQRERLIQNLESRPGSQLADRVRAATLRLQADPTQRDRIVRRLVDAATLSTSMTNWIAVAAWLDRIGEPAKLITTFPFEKARLDSGLLSLHMRSLSILGRWDEIEPNLKNRDVIIDPSQNHLLLAGQAIRQGKRSAAEEAFSLATSAAGRDADKLRKVALQAEQLSLPYAAIAVHEVLGQLPGESAASAREIVRLASGLGETQAALDAIIKVSPKLPGSVYLESEAAYLKVLLGDNLLKTRTELSRLTAQYPANRDVRLVQGLAELLTQNPTAARSLVDLEPISWENSPLRWQIIRIAVYGGTGTTDEARKAAAAMDISRLKPQELELIKGWRDLR